MNEILYFSQLLLHKLLNEQSGNIHQIYSQVSDYNKTPISKQMSRSYI